MTLDQIITKAQSTADKDGCKVVILNLNHIRALYVIRDYWDGCEKAYEYVLTVWPDPELVK